MFKIAIEMSQKIFKKKMKLTIQIMLIKRIKVTKLKKFIMVRSTVLKYKKYPYNII